MVDKELEEKIKELEKNIYEEIRAIQKYEYDIVNRLLPLEKKFEIYREFINARNSRALDKMNFIERRCMAIFDYLCSKDPDFKMIYSDMI